MSFFNLLLNFLILIYNYCFILLLKCVYFPNFDSLCFIFYNLIKFIYNFHLLIHHFMAILENCTNVFLMSFLY